MLYKIRKISQREIRIYLIALLFVFIFIYGYPTFDVVQDAAINPNNGELAFLHFDGKIGELTLSVYNNNADQLFSTLIYDASGGRAATCVWYENNTLYVGLPNKKILIQYNESGEIIQRQENCDVPKKEQWGDEWIKKGSCMYTELNGVTYSYDKKNYFLIRFWGQKRNLTITTEDGIISNVWIGPGNIIF